MKLSQDQMDGFRDAGNEAFRERLLVHVENHFPDQCHVLGKTQTENVVDYGIERAKHHDFWREDHIVDFVARAFTFGDRFDTASGQAWARKVLADKELKDPQVRMDALNDAALDHLESLSA